MARSLMELYGGGMVYPANNYQLGGLIARARRGREYQGEMRGLREQAEKAAKEQQRAGMWGSILGTVGAIAGSAIPVVGTYIGAGLGAGLGRFLGEKQFRTTKIGEGKYARDTRGDIREAQKEFKSAMGERALVSGIQSAIMGKAFGEIGKGVKEGFGGMREAMEAGSEMGLTKGQALSDYAKSFRLPETTYKGLGLGADVVSAAVPAGEIIEGGMFAKKPTGVSLPDPTQQIVAGQPLGGPSGTPSIMDPLGAQGKFSLADVESGFQAPSLLEGVPTGAEAALPLVRPPTPLMQTAADIYPEFEEIVGAGFGDIPVGEPAGLGTFTPWESPAPYKPYYGPGFAGGGLIDYMMPRGMQAGGYATATDPLQALEQMGFEEIASDPELQDYMEDLPQFQQGYAQQIGDITTAGQQQMGQLGTQMRQQQAQAGFAGAGVGAGAAQRARAGVGQEFQRGRRGVVESYQADLLAGIRDIETKGEFEFGGGGDAPMVGMSTGQQQLQTPPQNPAHGQMWSAYGVTSYWNASTGQWQQTPP